VLERKKISKYALRLSALLGLAFIMGWRPEFLSSARGHIHAASREIAAVDSSVDSSVVNSSVDPDFDDVIDNDNRCDSISEQDRLRLQNEAGLDLVAFVEESSRAMNQARTSEDQLLVIASKFDHQRWSKAWMPSEASFFGRNSEREKQIRETLRLQTSLSHASLFLTRYHRILEAGVRQETSALRAFHWDSDAQQELRREPVRAMVRGYVPHICSGNDVVQYGCESGETVFRVKALLSPRLSCRFPDKKPYYAAVFWVRISGEGSHREARILEIEANGDLLVKMTYDELVHKSLLSMLTPNVSEILIDAGLDPFRTPVMWRRLIQTANSKPLSDQGRRPSSN
jgi:hypothetical protein